MTVHLAQGTTTGARMPKYCQVLFGILDESHEAADKPIYA